MLGKILTISKNTATLAINKDAGEINDLINLHVVFEDKDNHFFRTLENGFIESKAIKIYYNSQVEKYNNNISKFTYLFVRVIKHLKKMQLFEFENEVEFEILKKEK